MESTRYCPDCRQARSFQQPHPVDGRCPDGPGGRCAEWLCVTCGAALLIADVHYLPLRAVTEYPHRRVA